MVYEIRKANTKDAPAFYFVQVARNGEIVATSELYTEKASAVRGATDAGADPHQIADKTKED